MIKFLKKCNLISFIKTIKRSIAIPKNKKMQNRHFGKIAMAYGYAVVLQDNEWALALIGHNPNFQQLSRPSNNRLVKPAAGYDGYMALDESGRIHVGPEAREFKRGREIAMLQDVVDVVSCEGHTVALHSDGTVTCVDEPMSHEGPKPFANEVANWHSIVQIACGFDFVAGLTSKGNLVSTGPDYRCPNWSGIAQFDAFNCYYGNISTIALLNNGKVVADFTEEVSEWHDVVRVRVGDRVAVGLKSNGTAYAVGGEQFVSKVQSWRHIIDIECKFRGAVAILSNGETVATWC